MALPAVAACDSEKPASRYSQGHPMKFASFKINGATELGPHRRQRGGRSRRGLARQFSRSEIRDCRGRPGRGRESCGQGCAASARQHRLAAGDPEPRQDPLHRPQLRKPPQGDRPHRGREPDRVRAFRQQPDRASRQHHPPESLDRSRLRGRTGPHHRQARPLHLAQGSAGAISPAMPATTKAACAITSATPISSRPARIFRIPARSVPGWSRPTRPAISARCGCKPVSMARWFRIRPSAR